MKTFCVFLSVFFVVATAFIPPSSAKGTAPQAVKTPSADDAALKKMTPMANPADVQNLLSSLMGEWDYTVTIWAEPGAKPQQSTGMTANEMILGGRFLSMKSSGIINVEGHSMPFEGQGLMGYDNIKKIFTSVWADTLGTGMMIGNGPYDSKEKVIKESGRFTASMTGKDQAFRSELHFTDSESYKSMLLTTGKSGKEFKTMEIDFHRKK